MGDGAMIFDDGQRIAGENFLNDVHIGKHRARRGGESRDAAVTLRKKALADERANDSVSYRVHG